MIREVEIILYVADQTVSKQFYELLLGKKPSLDVPGMTEFVLTPGLKLGLMPEHGVSKIITPKLPNPAEAKGIPRCELYLLVENVSEYYTKSLTLGALDINEPTSRDWGHCVAYVADPDGHVIAFAKPV